MSKDIYVREKRTTVVKREENISACAHVSTRSRAIWRIGSTHMSKEIYVCKNETYIDGKYIDMYVKRDLRV